MVRRILLRVTYAGKERVIEAPTELSVGRLAEIVGQALAPADAAEGLVRYELCLSGVPLAENERVGRVCASLQPGQALQVRVVRERTQPSAVEAGAAPRGAFRGALWVLGNRAIAVAGEWGVQLWDAEAQRWQPAPVVSLPVLQLAAGEGLLLCAFKRGGLALWEFDDAAQRWHGRANYRLPSSAYVTSLALAPTTAAVGTEQGHLYWLSLPDLELEGEAQPKPNVPVRLLCWADAQHCVKLDANGSIGVWRPNEVKPVFEESLAAPARVVDAVSVGAADTSWVLLLFAEPMQWMWVAMGAVRSSPAAPTPTAEPVSLAYGAKSRTAWVGFADGTVQAWQVNEVGQPPALRARYALGGATLRQVLLSRDERWLISIGEDNQVRVHVIQDLQER